MGNKKIYIITNESISDNSENYSCDNLDLKSIPEGLSKNFDTTIIARKSNLKRYHIIDNIKFQLAENVKVDNAFFKNGLLNIDLLAIKPEIKKVMKINIKSIDE